MRLWAEERKQGTLELLLTYPVGLWNLIFGKFFAALSFLGLLLLMSALLPVLLEVYGTGYSANLRARTLVLQVGFCHEVTFDLPDGIGVDIEQNSAQAERPARFTVKGIDKAMVGQFAASVRAVRPPEPYKGKGIRYAGEYVRRKEGKAFTGLER
jgi:hypothetical protein